MTTYKSVSAILVLVPVLNIVAAANGVVVGAFGGMLFDFFYRNYSSNYISEPYRKYYGGFC